MDNKPFIALDVSKKEEVEQLLSQFSQEVLNLKVGMELFYQEGASLIHQLKEARHSIFLDLKLHDIPTTVRKAMVGLAKLDIDMINIHAAGGQLMMKEALKGLEEGTLNGKKRPLLIAVTQLTSTSEEMVYNEQNSKVSLNESILRYAQLANDSGVDGVVCSALEAEKIKQMTREDFLCVTPGIRLKGDSADDQHRVASPSEARKLGSTYIVVGRSITKATHPKDAYEEVLNQWKGND